MAHGVDFAVPVGTPSWPGGGEDRLLGYADSHRLHGPHRAPSGSLYGIHAPSKGVAPVGSLVKAGDLVALSGATGLATGPHLHWEMRCGEIAVDPNTSSALGRRCDPSLGSRADTP